MNIPVIGRYWTRGVASSSTTCAREEWTYESSRAIAPGPGTLPGKVKVAIGDLIRSEMSLKELSNG